MSFKEQTLGSFLEARAEATALLQDEGLKDGTLTFEEALVMQAVSDILAMRDRFFGLEVVKMIEGSLRGTIYPVLRRFEQAYRLTQSEAEGQEQAAGKLKPRRYYTATELGAKVFDLFDETKRSQLGMSAGDAPQPEGPRFYPFSLVLGEDFRRTPYYGSYSKGDRRLRKKIEPLLGPSNPHVIGRIINVLADGQIRFRDIPEIEPHLGQGVTFHDPEKLYRTWGQRGDVGPVFEEIMRNLIENASRPNLP